MNRRLYTRNSSSSSSSSSLSQSTFRDLLSLFFVPSFIALTAYFPLFFSLFLIKNSVESRHGNSSEFRETGDSAVSGGPHGDSFSQK